MASTRPPAPTCCSISETGIPLPTASIANPATRMSEIRFEIVIVNRSLDAANAITLGKISSRAASMISIVMSRLVARGPVGSGNMPMLALRISYRPAASEGETRKMPARPPSGTRPRGHLVFAGSPARLGRIVRDVGEPVREHGPRRPARPVKKRKRPRAPGWGRSRPMGQALLAGGAELGRDVVERILQLAADRIDRPDDHHGNAGGDQAVFDSGGAAVVTQESLTHGHVVLPELSAEGRRSDVTYA